MKLLEDDCYRGGLAQREHYVRFDRQLRVIADKPIVLPVGHLDYGRRLIELI